jgi:pimeloyl-ACP methyl ester carboxylesterase
VRRSVVYRLCRLQNGRSFETRAVGAFWPGATRRRSRSTRIVLCVSENGSFVILDSANVGDPPILDGTPWHDRVAARSLLSFSWRRPVRRAASVRIPFLLVVPEADAIAPVPAALEVARRAPGAELFRSRGGGHYAVYEGRASFADVLRTEIDFLHRHAKAAPKGA